MCGVCAHGSQNRFLWVLHGSIVAGDQAAKWDSEAWHSFPRPQPVFCCGTRRVGPIQGIC